VCGNEVKRERGHIWPNTLPEGDPLRNVSAEITFHKLGRSGTAAQKADVCDECMTRWFKGIRGVST
jgi:hypothetical protein